MPSNKILYPLGGKRRANQTIRVISLPTPPNCAYKQDVDMSGYEIDTI